MKWYSCPLSNLFSSLLDILKYIYIYIYEIQIIIEILKETRYKFASETGKLVLENDEENDVKTKDFL